MTRLLILLITIFFLFPAPWARAAEPSITAGSAILMDLASGKVLYEKDSDSRMYPASTTKIMTAILALEKAKLQDEVKVSHDATLAGGTSVYLRKDEKQTLENLLYAMLLNSANDAAAAVAEHVGGSVETFVAMMNDKAQELGATQTHFTNPHGMPDSEHYTSARDLARITRYAMANDTFRSIVATRSRNWNGQDWQTKLISQNKLLGSYEGANGVKTGYTSQAGQTLVASALRGNEEYLAVVLKSSGANVWNDATRLLDYGFKNFDRLELARVGNKMVSLKLGGREVNMVAGRTVYVVNPTGEEGGHLETRVELGNLKLPLKTGQETGQVVFFENGEEVGRAPLLVERGVGSSVGIINWWNRLTTFVILLWLVRNLWQARLRRVRPGGRLFAGQQRRRRF